MNCLRSALCPTEPSVAQLYWYHVFSWFCMVYGIFVATLGVGLPITLGQALKDDSGAFARMEVFYLYLYLTAIGVLVAKYLVTHQGKAIINDGASSTRNWCSDLWSCVHAVITCEDVEVPEKTEQEEEHEKVKRKNASDVADKTDLDDTLDDRILEHVQDINKPVGRLGLRLGIKIFSLFILVINIFEITHFVELRLGGDQCMSNTKAVMVISQMLFIIIQTHYILNNNKLKLHKHSMLANFGSVHLLVTTFCTGVRLVMWQMLLKFRYSYGEISQSNDQHQDLPWLRSMTGLSGNLSNRSDLCSERSTMEEAQHNLGHYVFMFAMFYIFGCCIVLLFLYMHYREIAAHHHLALMLKQAIASSGSPFSAASGAGLIVGSIIVTILKITSKSSILVSVYLLLLHTHANILFAVMLFKLRRLGYDRRRDVRGDFVVLMFCLFGTALYNVFKHISSKSHSEEHEDASLTEKVEVVLEIVESIVEIGQALLQSIFFLVALKMYVPREEHKSLLPGEGVITHLTANNVAMLVIGLFMVHNEAFNLHDFMEQTGHNAAVAVIWIVLGSILIPWQNFYRFYSIILLVEIKKLSEFSKETSCEEQIATVRNRDHAENLRFRRLPNFIEMQRMENVEQVISRVNQ